MTSRRTAGWLFGLCLLGVGLQGAAAPAVLWPWGSFRTTASGFVSPSHDDQVDIKYAGSRLSAGAIWLLVRTTTVHSGPSARPRHQWADSRTCPALIPALAKLADLEPVTIQPPGLPWPKGATWTGGYMPPDQRNQQISDTDDYEISAPGRYQMSRFEGHVVLKGGGGSPVAQWVEETMKAVESCWSPKPPILPSGRP